MKLFLQRLFNKNNHKNIYFNVTMVINENKMTDQLNMSSMNTRKIILSRRYY